MSAIDNVAADARAFIDGLDRSVLGAFAVDLHALYLLHKASMYLLLYDEIEMRLSAGDMTYGLGEEREAASSMNEAAERLFHTGFEPEVRTAAVAELSYWWSISDDPALTGLAGAEAVESSYWQDASDEDYLDASPSHSARITVRDRVVLIASSPLVMHDYFAVGIWDTGLISRCIAEGIDPEIVMSMNGYYRADTTPAHTV